MKIIAIESSALVASAAIVTDTAVIAEYTMNNRKTHSQTLLPMIEEIVKSSETELKDVDAIAISRGPGSFTGLRIGSATAKGMGLALDIPLVEVSTLEGLAYNFYGTGNALVCPIMDARRQEVYSAAYRFSPELQTVIEESAGPLEELLKKLDAEYSKGHTDRVIFTGDAVPVYGDIIREKLAAPFEFAPIHLSRQRAACIGARAVELFKDGKTVTAAEHAPTYLRASSAERQANI